MQMQAVLDEASAAINVMLHIVDGAAALLDHDNVTPVYRAIKTWLCCGVGGSLYIQWAAMLGLAAAAWVGLAAALLQLRALDGLSGEDHERSTLSRHLWRAWHCVCVCACMFVCGCAHLPVHRWLAPHNNKYSVCYAASRCYNTLADSCCAANCYRARDYVAGAPPPPPPAAPLPAHLASLQGGGGSVSASGEAVAVISIGGPLKATSGGGAKAYEVRPIPYASVIGHVCNTAMEHSSSAVPV